MMNRGGGGLLVLALAYGLAGLQPARADSMAFRLIPAGPKSACGVDCQAVAMEGEITDATPEAFLRFMQRNLPQHPIQSVVYMHSYGGKVMAAMELGKIFRRLGLVAVVARVEQGDDQAAQLIGARCYSACVYALMGARKRVIPPQSELGLHKMYLLSIEGRQEDDGEMSQVLERYTRSMGVSPNVIVLAEHMRPEDVHIVSRAEISKWHLGSATL
ncbi:periplasmic protein-like protein [Beijerinckia indica subsp. indica ATCC 9039]|uniref:Periplasmic protein-like protein n=2 Tax=Beijerinckia TaxID=532 RepID=B2IHW8_BEII9|nr:periplasmic protein-like protein [Beijerinckia indica subsp. indica ATCC 9039]